MLLIDIEHSDNKEHEEDWHIQLVPESSSSPLLVDSLIPLNSKFVKKICHL